MFEPCACVCWSFCIGTAFPAWILRGEVEEVFPDSCEFSLCEAKYLSFFWWFVLRCTLRSLLCCGDGTVSSVSRLCTCVLCSFSAFACAEGFFGGVAMERYDFMGLQPRVVYHTLLASTGKDAQTVITRLLEDVRPLFQLLFVFLFNKRVCPPADTTWFNSRRSILVAERKPLLQIFRERLKCTNGLQSIFVST